LVASGYPSSFGAAYVSSTGTTDCTDASTSYTTAFAFDTCFVSYSYDHATKKSTAAGSIKYTVSGTTSITATVTSYSDTTCTTSFGTVAYSGTSTCTIDGSGMTFNGTDYGKMVLTSSFPDAPDAPGVYGLGFESKCNTEPYSGMWFSLATLSSLAIGTTVSAYDTCASTYKVSCANGVLSATQYSVSGCTGTASALDEVDVNPSDCSKGTDDDVGGDDVEDFTSDEMYETSYCTAGTGDYTFTPLSDDDGEATCFAGSEMVTLESGASKLIADVVVGDRVLAANAQGAFLFSDVIAVPHAKNNDRVTFNEISLANGADIRMTGEHLLPVAASCGVDAVFAVTAAKDVAANSCVMTVNGQSAVVSNNKVAGAGIYTIVTNEEYVVVNGVVASPFATSHAMGNTFYNVYRAMYNYVPGLFKSSLFQTFHATFAHLAMKTW